MSFINYPDTYYTAVTPPEKPRPPVQADMEIDTCIIGAGLSGLCTALSLAERGVSSVIVDKNRVGWGASGRNAGMAISGFDAGMDHVLKKQGLKDAGRLYALTLDAMALIRRRILEYGINCGPQAEGTAIICRNTPSRTVERQVEDHNRNFGSRWEYWDRETTVSKFRSDRLKAAIFMPESFHLQPLAYSLGLARAAEDKGATIYEETGITGYERRGGMWRLRTDRGHTLSARTVICAGSGYLSGKLPLRIRAATMPIETYIGVTEPLCENLLARSVACAYGAFDDRNVMNYFRLLPDRRLLWGGGHDSISLLGKPSRLEDAMRRDLEDLFPALAGTRIEKIWSGVQGYSLHRMPQIRQVFPAFWVNMGHGGQGLVTTALGGELIARAIAENDSLHRLMDPYGLAFTGGRAGLIFAAALAKWMKWQDLYAERSNRQKS